MIYGCLATKFCHKILEEFWMKIKSWTFCKEVCWDQLQALGVPRTYYELECWILANALDPLVLKKIKPIRIDHDTLTLWRAYFITVINEWSFYEGARQIADSLSMRCFVRAYMLNEPTPSDGSLRAFYEKNKYTLDDVMPFIAALWGSTKGKNASLSWVKLMDEWAQKTLSLRLQQPDSLS